MRNKALLPLPTLATERLILRPLLESDAQQVFSLRSDAAINKFLDRKRSETVEDAVRFIRNVQDSALFYWAVAQKPAGELIGTICLYDFSNEQTKCEIGYELLTGYQGKGLMGEAVEKIIAFAFQTLGVKTIDAVTHQHNHSSTKLLQKFKFEKTEVADPSNPDLLLFRLSN